MESSNREFWNFSDQIRLQTANLEGLSIGDSIWSDSFLTSGRRPDERRNLDSAAGAGVLGAPDLNSGPWKAGLGAGQKLAFGNSTSFDRNNYKNNNNSVSGSLKSGGYFNGNNFNNGEIKNYFNKAIAKPVGNDARKNLNVNINNIEGKGIGKKKNTISNNDGGTAVDKRFKTLPPSEALPRSEAVGGYIFVCNNDTMHENMKRQLFGLPPRYRDSVRAITPGLPLFLYNYSTHQLHGIFEAASFGGTNIDPLAWEDKKCPGESRFPAQVRVVTRNICEPLEEDSFRPILHHYDGPKFRLELSVPEALALLDIFAENNV